LIATDSDILWELIPMICHRLRGLNEFRFKTFNYCEQLLLEVSVLCKPKEVLIAFLAELETDTIGGNDGSESSSSMATACDHNVFKAILKPLECVLIQLPTKRNETLKWVLSTLNAHISRLSTDTIDDYQFDGQEKQFIDNDPNAKQINSVLPLYISFIQTFVNEVDVTKKSAMASTTAPTANGQTVAASKTSDPQVQRTVLLKALLRLLDHPLLHLDLSSETCGESRALAIDVVRLISRLQSNYYSLIERIDLISSSKRSAKHADSADIAVTKEVFAAAMANLSYLVHTECALSAAGGDDLDIDSFVPCVYTHVYVLGVHLPYVDALLRSSVCLVYEKGLHLADRLLSHINDMELEAHFVDLIRATPVERSLIALMVYSPVESHRKRALHVFRRLIVAFDGAGRYKMLVSILSQPAQHAGVQGLAIGIYKDFMFTSALFQGSHLHRWLKLAIKCALPDGVGTDLLEQNDTIFAALNAIRYACLKDHKAANETKLWDVMPYVRDQLLRPLHKALDLSRAHYKLELCKLRELKSGGGKGKGGPGVEVRIAGGGNGLLPNLPPDHKHRIVLLALQNFDLIESVLVRVEEIVDE
jgi:hypothetical protein